MNTQVKRRKVVAMKAAATTDRNFRTFLLMAQLEAEAIGRRIAQARKEMGLTQEELAEMASFSKRSLQDYEAGTTIPYKHLREIGGLVQKDVEWMLHGPSEPTESEAESPASEEIADLRSAMQSEMDEIREKLDRLLALQEADRRESA